MERHLLLFSGGKDSFLAAAMYAEKGVPITLISMNNGAVAAEEHLMHGVTRLQNRYGRHLVTYAGICLTYGTLQRLRRCYANTPHAALAAKYPSLCQNQLQCLYCQSAMWVAAIAYAVAKNIKHIAAGYHAYDEFCTGCQEWTDRISGIACRYGIRTHFPVWDEDSWQDKDARDMVMMDRGFEPQVLEPKCMLGLPAGKPDGEMARELVRYFDDNIRDMMPELIDGRTPHYRVARLSEKSMRALDYKIQKPVGEIY